MNRRIPKLALVFLVALLSACNGGQRAPKDTSELSQQFANQFASTNPIAPPADENGRREDSYFGDDRLPTYSECEDQLRADGISSDTNLAEIDVSVVAQLSIQCILEVAAFDSETGETIYWRDLTGFPEDEIERGFDRYSRFNTMSSILPTGIRTTVFSSRRAHPSSDGRRGVNYEDPNMRGGRSGRLQSQFYSGRYVPHAGGGGVPIWMSGGADVDMQFVRNCGRAMGEIDEVVYELESGRINGAQAADRLSAHEGLIASLGIESAGKVFRETIAGLKAAGSASISGLLKGIVSPVGVIGGRLQQGVVGVPIALNQWGSRIPQSLGGMRQILQRGQMAGRADAVCGDNMRQVTIGYRITCVCTVEIDC